MSPADIDNMRFYLAIVYTRRLKKAGYFDSSESKAKHDAKPGDRTDFVKLFGS